MNQTDLIARVRRNAFIRDNHPNYIDQIILDELNDSLRSIYEDLITLPRQGHWLKQYTFTSTVNQDRARITPRAVVGGVEKVEIGEVGQVLRSIDEVVEDHAQWYESFAGVVGTPTYYVIRGDQLEFLPAFDRAMTVRVTYYIKPSLLIPAQGAPSTDGLVQSVTNTAVSKVIVVSAVPHFNGGAGAIPTTTSLIDVIHPDGTCELSLVGNAITGIGGTIYTLPVTTDLTDVQVGDYVRFAGQTDWPPLPEEFHRTLADAASIKIMLQLNMTNKAATIAGSVSGDLERLRTLMNTARTRRNPKRIGLSMVTLGQGPRSYPRFP